MLNVGGAARGGGTEKSRVLLGDEGRQLGCDPVREPFIFLVRVACRRATFGLSALCRRRKDGVEIVGHRGTLVRHI